MTLAGWVQLASLGAFTTAAYIVIPNIAIGVFIGVGVAWVCWRKRRL